MAEIENLIISKTLLTKLYRLNKIMMRDGLVSHFFRGCMDSTGFGLIPNAVVLRPNRKQNKR